DTVAVSKFSKNEINDVKNNSSFDILTLLETYSEQTIESKMIALDSVYKKYPFMASLLPKFVEVKTAFETLKQNATPWKTYVPKIIFYANNQYHRWLFGDAPWFAEAQVGQLKGVLRGDFGISYIDSLPVSD